MKRNFSIKSAFKKGDKFENAYGATITIDDPDKMGRIQFVVKSGDTADCRSVDGEDTMQKMLDQNGYIKCSKENKMINHAITSGLLDKAEEMRKHLDSAVDEVTIVDDFGTEYTFVRDDDHWVCSDLNAEQAALDKFGISLGDVLPVDELMEIFGDSSIDDYDSYNEITDDNITFELNAEEKDEEDDSAYEEYEVTSIEPDHEEWYEGEIASNQEMFDIIRSIENGDGKYYSYTVNENISAEDVL